MTKETSWTNPQARSELPPPKKLEENLDDDFPPSYTSVSPVHTETAASKYSELGMCSSILCNGRKTIR